MPVSLLFRTCQFPFSPGDAGFLLLSDMLLQASREEICAYMDDKVIHAAAFSIGSIGASIRQELSQKRHTLSSQKWSDHLDLAGAHGFQSSLVLYRCYTRTAGRIHRDLHFGHLCCEASHDLSRVLPTACLAAGPPFGVRTAFPLYSLGSAVTLPQQ